MPKKWIVVNKPSFWWKWNRHQFQKTMKGNILEFGFEFDRFKIRQIRKFNVWSWQDPRYWYQNFWFRNIWIDNRHSTGLEWILPKCREANSNSVTTNNVKVIPMPAKVVIEIVSKDWICLKSADQMVANSAVISIVRDPVEINLLDKLNERLRVQTLWMTANKTTPVVQLGPNHLARKRPLRAKLFQASFLALTVPPVYVNFSCLKIDIKHFEDNVVISHTCSDQIGNRWNTNDCSLDCK